MSTHGFELYQDQNSKHQQAKPKGLKLVARKATEAPWSWEGSGQSPRGARTRGQGFQSPREAEPRAWNLGGAKPRAKGPRNWVPGAEIQNSGGLGNGPS